VSRSPRQVQLRRFLRGCEVLAFSPAQAHRVGTLLAATGTSDVVDAHVALVGSGAQAAIWTSDPDHLRLLAGAADHPAAVRKL
ncbi:MAG: twitching motility protein PilT, partial [Candidatus Dormibacteraceae bacterium]